MRLHGIALMTGLLLSGCAPELSSSAGLSVIEYTRDFQSKAADEIEGGMCPALNVIINDCSVLRDQARVK